MYKAILTHYFFFLLCLGLFVSAFNIAIAQDYLDYLMNRCVEGDSEACNEIEILIEKNKKLLDSMNAQADAFHAESPKLDIENNKTPNIKKAYSIILKRYINSKTVIPSHKKAGLDSELISICSQHLHDLYFVHNKKIPLLESGRPDWAVIYTVTIDHYFRYCSKSINQN